LPHSSLNGDLRMTEQGETIAQKYANKLNAAYNLELLIAGVAGATINHWNTDKSLHPLESEMDYLSSISRKKYESLINTDGFIDFFREATPIDVIELSSIGSRPARRSGKKTLEDLRAIPWVFSWSQARFYLSGWFGVGTALKQLITEKPEIMEQIKSENFIWSPLHYITSNAASSLATADPEIMKIYSNLVADKNLRDRIMQQILEEYSTTKEMLEYIYNGPLNEKRQNFHRLIILRQERLKILHEQQLFLLKKWRKSDDKANSRILPELLLTVNAIASGLRTTG
jgi:phosphoenolpyruvate carboxylase